MESISNPNHYKIISKIVDKKQLDVEQLSQYKLFFELSDRYVKYCIQDNIHGSCLLFEYYEFDYKSNEKQIIAILEDIFKDHALLEAGYWHSIQLSISSSIFSLIPSQIYDIEYREEYLSINVKIPESSELCTQNIKSQSIINIFAVKKEIINWFKKKYPTKHIEISHHTSTLIDKGLKLKTDKHVLVDIEGTSLTLVYCKNNELILCNEYYCETEDEKLYSISLLYQTLKLSKIDVPLIISGEIEENEKLILLLNRFFKEISFNTQNKNVYFNYLFDDLRPYQHSRLFDLMI